MHTNFSDWYRKIKLKPEEEWIEKRWQGIEEFEFPQKNDYEIVRIFYNPLKCKNPDIYNQFKEHFQKFDSVIPIQDNDREYQLLAGASVVNLIENDEDIEYNLCLALSAMTKNFSKYGPAPIIQEHLNTLNQYIIDQSIYTHQNFNEENISISNIGKLKIDSLKNISTGDYVTVDAFVDLLNQLITTVNKKFDTLTQKINDTSYIRNVLLDETNILWWIIGECSRDLDTAFKQLSYFTASIIAGKEIADLINVFPGPYAIKAILKKMLQACKKEKTKKTTIKDSINRLPIDWRKNILKLCQNSNFSVIEDFCPLHFAILQSVQFEGHETNWLAIFKKNTQVDPEQDIDPLELSMQMYYESLLRRLNMNQG